MHPPLTAPSPASTHDIRTQTTHTHIAARARARTVTFFSSSETFLSDRSRSSSSSSCRIRSLSLRATLGFISASSRAWLAWVFLEERGGCVFLFCWWTGGGGGGVFSNAQQQQCSARSESTPLAIRKQCNCLSSTAYMRGSKAVSQYKSYLLELLARSQRIFEEGQAHSLPPIVVVAARACDQRAQLGGQILQISHYCDDDVALLKNSRHNRASRRHCFVSPRSAASKNFNKYMD
jgi:hypothetical protein